MRSWQATVITGLRNGTYAPNPCVLCVGLRWGRYRYDRSGGNRRSTTITTRVCFTRVNVETGMFDISQEPVRFAKVLGLAPSGRFGTMTSVVSPGKAESAEDRSSVYRLVSGPIRSSRGLVAGLPKLAWYGPNAIKAPGGLAWDPGVGSRKVRYRCLGTFACGTVVNLCGSPCARARGGALCGSHVLVKC